MYFFITFVICELNFAIMYHDKKTHFLLFVLGLVKYVKPKKFQLAVRFMITRLSNNEARNLAARICEHLDI